MAPQQGHVNAQFSLGIAYYLGIGVPENKTEAIKWIRRAAELGHEGAVTTLTQIQNEAQLAENARRRADEEHRRAMQRAELRRVENEADAAGWKQAGEAAAVGTAVLGGAILLWDWFNQ